MTYAYGHSSGTGGIASNHQSGHPPLTLPHSKSLDHYGDHHSNQPRYSSFDHQYYEQNRASCECTDGYQTCAPINQFYNIPGSRSALPFSLSNHLLTGVQQTASNGIVLQSCNNFHKFPYPPAATNEYDGAVMTASVPNHHHHHHQASTHPQHHGNETYCRSCDGNMFRQSSSIQQPSSVAVQSSAVTVNHYCDNAAENYVANNGATVSVTGYHTNAKNSRPITTATMDRLIDFDDRPIASGAGIYANTNKSDYYDSKQYRTSDNIAASGGRGGGHIVDRSYLMRQRHSLSQPQPQITQLSSDDIDLTYAKCLKQHGAIPALTAIIKKLPSLDCDQVDAGGIVDDDDHDDCGDGGNAAPSMHLCPANSAMAKRKFLPSSLYAKTDKYKNNADLLAEYEALHINNGGSCNSRKSDFNSYDEYGTDYTNHTTPTTTAANSCKSVAGSMSNKNQDGVGSYESWDYVYKILERQGYNKERGDLLVRGLDLNPIPDANAEKKIFWDEDGRATTVTVSHRTDDATVPAQFLHDDLRHETIKPPEHYDGVIPPPIVGRETGKLRSASGGINGSKNGVRLSNGKLPVNGSSGGGGGDAAAAAAATIQSKSQTKNVPLNHLENCQAVDAERRQLQEQQMRQQQQQPKALAKRQQVDKEASVAGKHHSSTTVVGKENGTTSAPHRTAHNRKSAAASSEAATTTASAACNGNNSNNEWSCKFCTFLNPSSTRICSMCSKSKDFNLDAPKKSTATCI